VRPAIRPALRRIGLAALVLASGVLPGQAASGPTLAVITADGVALLTAIDFVPDRAALDALLGADAEQQLIEVGSGTGDPDPGVRLRAIRALALYPTVTSRQALAAMISFGRLSVRGRDVLFLRAAIEALGAIGDPDDVGVLLPLLQFEPSRDVRATTADALRELGSVAAIEPLRQRFAEEQSDQVRLAISQALRELGM
jgi:HEAT repeat protein